MSGSAGGGFDQDAFNQQTLQAEAGGNAGIGYHNRARSSAAGPFGITDPTWMGLARKHPELGLTAANRFDPAANVRAKNALTQDDAAFLQGHGITPSSYALGMTATLGPAAGLAMLQAAPGANALGVISGALGMDQAQRFARANPEMLAPTATAGDVQGRARGAYGGPSAGGGTPSASGAPNPQAQVQLPPQAPPYVPPPATASPQAPGLDPSAYLALLAPSYQAIRVNYDPFAVMPKL